MTPEKPNNQINETDQTDQTDLACPSPHVFILVLQYHDQRIERRRGPLLRPAIQGSKPHMSGTITIVDTATSKVVKTITYDPGCHGVNFGAKKCGGYYAYVTSKFANRLIVLDYDPNRDGDARDAVIAGWVVLANNTAPSDDKIIATDDKTNGNNGMGGQGVLPVPQCL